MNELEKVLNFEGKEIKVKTDNDVELFNLTNSAKVCGLVKKKSNGTEIVNWKSGSASVCHKLNTILSGGSINPPQYIDELNYIVNEIEETDDRNSIYMSRYLTSRLAMECHNDSANKYKDWLAKLDEKYSNGELVNINNSEISQFNAMANQFMNMTNTMSSTMVQLGQAFNGIQTFVKDSIQAKDYQISYIEDIIGVRDINVKKLSKNLKIKVEEIYKKKVWATTKEYKEAKEKLFRTFDITAWEQIPVLDYNKVNTYISNL
jgi:DNA repair ATPase RecN